MRAVHQAILSEMLSLALPPRTALDIGCGKGVLTHALASALPQCAITAMDTPAIQRFPAARSIAYARGSAENMPFPDESFDAALAALSLHHWKDKPQGIREAYRVLKPGGRLVIGDPLLENRMGNRFLGKLAQALDSGSFTDKKTLTGYLNDAGFTSVRFRLVPGTMHTTFLVTAVK